MTDDSWRGLLPDTIRRAEGSIYHYTSAAGLLGLVENGELWATEASGIDDMVEVRQAWEFIQKWLTTQDPDHRATQVLRHTFRTGGPMNRLGGLFTCCASTAGDDADQWRRYGALGRGYAIELDARTQLAALFRDDVRHDSVGSSPLDSAEDWEAFADSLHDALAMAFVGPWLHVLYTDEEKTQALDDLAKNAQSRWLALADVATDDQGQRSDVVSLTEVIVAFAQVALLMKSQGSSSEREVRATVATIGDACSMFRATDAGIGRHVRLVTGTPGLGWGAQMHRGEMSSGVTVPLESVRLGPLHTGPASEAVLRDLLYRYRYDGSAVRSSEVDLRP